MGKITLGYAELASLSVRQEFYANKLCRKYHAVPVLDFTLVPTDECRSVMRKLDVVFRSADSRAGFILMARVHGKNAGGNDLLRFPPGRGEKLSFWMMLRNPDVMNFDDLPTVKEADKIYHFTNQQSDELAPRGDLHLSTAAAGVGGASDRIKKATANYRFHNRTAVAAGTAMVKHILTEREVTPHSLINQSGQCDLMFNLASLPIGKCRLLIDGHTKEEFFYVGAADPGAFGVVELAFSKTHAANYRLVESDRALAKPHPGYTILFPNRKTRWRYTIHLQPNSSLSLEMARLTPAEQAEFFNRLNIVTNDTAITFACASASATDIVFISNTALALQEKYISSSTRDPLSLTLQKCIGVVAKEAVVRSDLSYPATALIDATDSPSVYSDVLLTL